MATQLALEDPSVDEHTLDPIITNPILSCSSGKVALSVKSTDAGASDNEREESILRYFSALCHAKVALGAALSDNIMFNFAWCDAFKPPLVVSSRSCDFERVAVL